MGNYLQNQALLVVLCVTAILFEIPATAQTNPSDLMRNCKQWKITYPTGAEVKQICGITEPKYFYLNTAKDAIVFRAPISSNNGTTPNSSYIRSELRERTADGTMDISWTTAGKHMIYVRQAITHLPMTKPHLVATQIHGDKAAGIDDAMVMRLEGKKLFLSFNGGKLRSDVLINSNYVLGTKHEVIFLVVDGKHYCYYSEDGNLKTAYNNSAAAQYLVKDGSNDYVMNKSYDQTYFKVGNYTQSNPDTEGSNTDKPENYGEVLVYDFAVGHGNDALSIGGGGVTTPVVVTGVTLTPATANVSMGATLQLTPTISPSNATNKTVTYKSSNTSVATVSSTGLVTAVAAGNADITVTTTDGEKTDVTAVTVTASAVKANLALNKPITGTGTPDGINVAGNLVDGSTDTRWAVSGFPQTATIDLGQTYFLEGIELVCYGDRDYKFIVSASTAENGSYTQIADRSDNTAPGTVANPISNTFSGVHGRYVKITVTGAATYTGPWMSLSEFRVFGSAMTLSINNHALESNDVSLWPNPTTNTVNISGAKDFEILTIYDMAGKKIIQHAIQSDFIDISNLSAGLYMFSFSGNNKIESHRIIKK